jgi:serine/threonine protein kinase
MPPEPFGRYELLERLGRGGMGEVYRAHDTAHDRTVAVKRLLPEYVADQQFRARFYRECHAAARLNDPHVIPIHDFGEIDGRLYLDMRLVEGRDLADLLRESGPLSPDQAVDVATQVASALDAAHAAGLIHRDVKPSNVLVDRSGPTPHCYLVDFGVAGLVGARTTGSLTRTGMIAGTLDYIAPERLESRHVDARADVYSLACLLHEALTGAPPFDCDTVAALCYAHLLQEPPRASATNPAVPAALDAVIARGMAKDPQERPARAGELAAAARAALREGREPSPARVAHRPAPSTVVPRPPDGAPAAGSGSPAVGPPPVMTTGPALRLDSRRPAGSASRRRPTYVLVAGVLLVATMVGGMLLGGLWRSAEATTVRVEPAVDVGPDAFTPASTGRKGPTGPTVVGAPTLTSATPTPSGPVSGGTPGLYGGTGSNTCDAAALATFLEQHPDRGGAWAGALGLRPSDIRPYLETLTAVVLRTDTAVTNHGFVDGTATPFHSVLQAGTAVLVDREGVPRVRCACGNPLAEPADRPNPDYQGMTWTGFDSDAVTVIVEARTEVTAFVVVDDATSEVDVRPAGTAGEQDEPAPDDVAAEARKFGTGGPSREPASESVTSAENGPTTNPDGEGTDPDGETSSDGTPSDDPSTSDPRTGAPSTESASEQTSTDTGEPSAPGTEAGTQTEPERGTETGTDPGSDPGTEPGSDPGTDPGTDTGTEPQTDPETDPGTGTGTGTDTGTGTGTDTGTDTETGTETGTEPEPGSDPAP